MTNINMKPDDPATVSMANEEAVQQMVQETVLDLWEIVNNLTRLRPSKQERYRVTLFGSARTQPGNFVYEEVKRASAALTAMGCDIITGGGPGLMQAANEGAAESNAEERNRSIGIRISLPFEQDVNPFVGQVFTHRTFFTRLHHFVMTSNAFVVAPGGIGTVLETMMIWQLLQVKHLYDTPLILVGPMWESLIEWAKDNMLSFDPPMADPLDMTIPRCLATADEAIELIQQHHIKWLEEQRAAGNGHAV